jgi:hypothetical protein
MNSHKLAILRIYGIQCTFRKTLVVLRGSKTQSHELNWEESERSEKREGTKILAVEKKLQEKL